MVRLTVIIQRNKFKRRGKPWWLQTCFVFFLLPPLTTVSPFIPISLATMHNFELLIPSSKLILCREIDVLKLETNEKAVAVVQIVVNTKIQ